MNHISQSLGKEFLKAQGYSEEDIEFLESRRISKEPVVTEKTNLTIKEVLELEDCISLTAEHLLLFTQFINEEVIPEEQKKYWNLVKTSVSYQPWEIRKLVWGWKKDERESIARSMMNLNNQKMNFPLCVVKAVKVTIWKLSTGYIPLYPYTRGVLNRMGQ